PRPQTNSETPLLPAESSTSRWQPGCPRCDQRWEHGLLQKGLMIAGVATWLSVLEQGNRFVVSVAVLNDSKQPVDVKPDGFTLRVVDPPSKAVAALPLEKLQQRRSVASRIVGAAAGGATGYENAKYPEKKTGSGTIYNKDGSRSDVDIYGPNTVARDQQAQAQ